MLELCYFPGNASVALHTLLEEIGASFGLRLVDRANTAHKRPDYLKLNPNRRRGLARPAVQRALAR